MAISVDMGGFRSPFQLQTPTITDFGRLALPPVSLQNPFEQAPVIPDAMAPLSAENALNQLENSYLKLKESINLKKLNPARIDQYIEGAQIRMHKVFSEAEKARLRKLATSQDPETLRMLALELRIGIPKRVEKEALASLGRLILFREQEATLKAFLADPDKDPNLKAHVKTILTMQRVEKLLYGYERFRKQLSGLPGSRLLPSFY